MKLLDKLDKIRKIEDAPDVAVTAEPTPTIVNIQSFALNGKNEGSRN